MGRMHDAAMPLPSATDSAEGAVTVEDQSGVRVAIDRDRAHPLPEEASETRFRGMVSAHFDFIWRTLRGLGVPARSADDAAQHVFLVASQKLASITPGSERAFLYGTAVGVASNARRSMARNREVLDEGVFDTHADDAPNGEELVEMRERRALLDEVLCGMPDDLRAVFVLYVLEGIDSIEIADILGIPRGTVASRLRRARETFTALAKRVHARSERGGAR